MKTITGSRNALLGLMVLLSACDGVTYVDRVTVVNETDYAADVAVQGDDGSWLGLGRVSADEMDEFEEVIDQGPLWTFRFSYGKYPPVELEISKDDLREAGWQVEVPDELEEKLRAEGVSPPP
jgi:hypothetical protein